MLPSVQATSVIASGTVRDVPDRHTARWYLALFRRDTCGASDRRIRALKSRLDVEPQVDYAGGVKWQDHITIDPVILVGKPVVKGTRIAVELVVDLLGRGYTVEQVLQQYGG